MRVQTVDRAGGVEMSGTVILLAAIAGFHLAVTALAYWARQLFERGESQPHRRRRKARKSVRLDGLLVQMANASTPWVKI
jgi:hypothetical protein